MLLTYTGGSTFPSSTHDSAIVVGEKLFPSEEDPDSARRSECGMRRRSPWLPLRPLPKGGVSPWWGVRAGEETAEEEADEESSVSVALPSGTS